MKSFARQSRRAILRDALDSMLPALELAYAQGGIRTESDLNYAVVHYLKETLPSPTPQSRWVIGANHSLYGVRPDVACYYVACPFVDFIALPEQSLVGVVEIKFASDINDDLGKLRRLQQKQDVLAWMVYGDHFCKDIHATYYEHQLRRERKICKWSASRSNRGFTILKCGELHKHPHLCDHCEVILAYNSRWWIRDNEEVNAEPGAAADRPRE
jgi:hypothetical protein